MSPNETGAAQPTTLSVAQAAARVGLTPATLRTWHRRYGLGPSVRTPGGHRRYDEQDLTRLRAVARLVDDGYPAAEAVAACAQLQGGDPDPVPTQRHSASGGGNVVALPGGDDIQRGLARAAMSLDGRAISQRVDELLDQAGVIATWQEVLVPVLAALGERWARTQRGVEIEHVAAEAITHSLRTHGAPVTREGRPIMLACMPEESHLLALTALQAALRESGEPTVLLGARVPEVALTDAVRRLRPRRLVLWSQLETTADTSLLAALPTQRPPLGVVLAGPGWSHAGIEHAGLEHPASVHRPDSLEQAVDGLLAS